MFFADTATEYKHDQPTGRSLFLLRFRLFLFAPNVYFVFAFGKFHLRSRELSFRLGRHVWFS